jgi:acyl-coenzyme A synthetase/AMP-(fatty) acid ligase
VCATTTAELLAACRDHDVRELQLPPHAARALVRLMSGAEPWARLIRHIRVVGGPLPASVAEQVSQRFPHAQVVSFYGLTEGGAALCVRVVGRGDHDSIGRPMPGTEVHVLDDEGRRLPAGAVGELTIRAPGTSGEVYFGQGRALGAGTPDGWARTGDMGFVDESGTIRLVGRARELIFLRAGRVSPEAVEEILSRLVPDSIEFAVVGLPIVDSWDRIAIFLAGRADSPELAAVCQRLATMKGPFRPQVVRVVDAIPRGSLGKPIRRQLAQELTAET